MSILIKGMKKPKACCFMIDGETELCPFVNTDDDCVLQPGENCYGTWEELYAGCPLGELPEKHGRLIDADALIEDLKHDIAVDMDTLDYEELSELNRILVQSDKDIKQNAIDLLEHSKPVIEAEGEG